MRDLFSNRLFVCIGVVVLVKLATATNLWTANEGMAYVGALICLVIAVATRKMWRFIPSVLRQERMVRSPAFRRRQETSNPPREL